METISETTRNSAPMDDRDIPQTSSPATLVNENPNEHVSLSSLDDGRFDLQFDDKVQQAFDRQSTSITHFVNVPHDQRRQARKATQQAQHDNAQKQKVKRTPWYRNDSYRPVNVNPNVVPRMNVAILITGSRGDVQPFIALGQRLKKLYGHRVRIGTHPVFKDFVEQNDLEFYSIGADPAKLMAYMVKNPGILPTKASRKAGDVSQRRAEIEEMLEGAWAACTMAGDGVTSPVTRQHPAHYHTPFTADAIISNPPTYASLHIAEKLSIPLHMCFTMPWSPTTAFPHPLANLDAAKVDAKIANYMSYSKIELLTWEGLQDLINRFREQTLGLDPISPTWGYLLFQRLKIPFTYCWSEALIPKPADWGPHIDISGFFFLPLASTYTPDAALQAFLDASGDSPILYVGFGSIVIDDPAALTAMIFAAVARAGVRAIISRGWANIGTDPPENCHVIDNVPHDWLFTKVTAVCHHGGAGTTAAGIALAKPTIIVPFFGDQPFWGGMVARAGAGPPPVPYKELTTEKLTECIRVAVAPGARAKAEELAGRMRGEDGVQSASESFQRNLNAEGLKCFIFPERVAVWRLRRTNVVLSSLAAGILVANRRVNPERLKLVRKKEWFLSEGAQAPVAAVMGAVSSLGVGLATDIIDFRRSSTHPEKGEKARDTSPIKATSKHNSDTPSSEKIAASAAATEPPPPALRNAGTFKKYKKYGRTRRLAANVATHLGRAPVAFFYNLANGFHNAPEFLLADGSVRKRGDIDDLRSGAKVAGTEFVMNIYDAFAGLVRNPYDGFCGTHCERDLVTLLPYHVPRARSTLTPMSRLTGLLLGILQALLGFPFKLLAAAFALPGYFLKGLEREVQRRQDGIASHTGRVNDGVRQRLREIEETGGTWVERDQLWTELSQKGSGNPVVDVRVWEAHREVRRLRAGGEEGEEARRVEKEVLKGWERLGVDAGFLGL